MNITIVPFTIDQSSSSNMSSGDYGKEAVKDHPPITYWKIYLDDKYFSFVSSRELAEKTKQWIEKWLKN
ncbi:MAG TPA: hypothetical protein VLB01_01335 [Thermodesulfobacteriota bacterium]|nr:hypothetical protein [Thermodesulfobacteriota bacterium]